MRALEPGSIVWLQPPAAVGREQSERRPAMVVSGVGYLSLVDSLALVVPITGVDRGWPNHVRIEGGRLGGESWAMTEQVRAVSRERIVGRAGRATEHTLLSARVWIRDFLEL